MGQDFFTRPAIVLEILTLPANKIKRNIKKISHDSFWKLTGHQGIDILVYRFSSWKRD